MVAVLAFIQSFGGSDAPAIASPTSRVVTSRDSRISRRLAALYRQLTLRPARLMTASAPSSARTQSPLLIPSHLIVCHGAGSERRETTTGDTPRAWRCRARI